MDLWEIYKASKGVPHSGDLYDALMGKALGGAGSVWETENAPYLFRQSGGLLNSRLLGKEKDCLVGASVGWNQLQASTVSRTNSGITYAYSNGALTVSGEATATSWWLGGAQGTKWDWYKDHIYLIDIGNPNYSVQSSADPYWYAPTGLFNNQDVPFTTPKTIKKAIATVNNWLQYKVPSGYEFSNAVVYKPQVFDLTLMLGSTIADYAYTLESGTAGAGIAWLRSYGFFSEDYYGYDSGSLQSVNAVKHIMKDGSDNIIGEYPLADLELRGVFKMDADHKIYAEGDRYESSGTVTRKYGVVDLGTLNWNVAWGGFSTSGLRGIAKMPRESSAANLVCSKYPTVAYESRAEKTIYGADPNGQGTADFIAVMDSAYADKDAFKTAMNGVYLVYELATPTTETASPYTTPQQVSKDGTEQYVIAPINQWDEEWELGLINTSTGEPVPSNDYVRSKNFIPVKPNTEYYIRVPIGDAPLFFYDEDFNYITPYFGGVAGTFTTPASASFMKFRLGSNYGTTYNHDISINYPSTDTAYHPHSEKACLIPIGHETQYKCTPTP